MGDSTDKEMECGGELGLAEQRNWDKEQREVRTWRLDEKPGEGDCNKETGEWRPNGGHKVECGEETVGLVMEETGTGWTRRLEARIS